jgi:hypothetical protein
VDRLDPGIKDLVINVGRIPNVETMTNCEGHVYREMLSLPTKHGWIYFLRRQEEHINLIESIDSYCNNNLFFVSYEGPWGEDSQQTIEGLFEPYSDGEEGKFFANLPLNEQEAYFQRAEVRKKELLKGWTELNHVIINYILNNITKDIESLPYQNKDDGALPFRMCGF